MHWVFKVFYYLRGRIVHVHVIGEWKQANLVNGDLYNGPFVLYTTYCNVSCNL